ncbi:uncharacterized protein [Venturia canescens]|uniref:uncharacterized protein n=1 Tax=Venturia canescens TaxID=32260 RepID=UPI001C9D52C4|nr:uncharacterized protein LOC122411373 [Venturia canescens]
MQADSSVTVQAHLLQTVSSILPSFEMCSHAWPHLNNLRLADPDFLKPRPIDIILGADVYGLIIKPNILNHSPSMPIAQLSIFGWLVLGPVHSTPSTSCTTFHVKAQTDNNDLQQLLTKFWIQEELPSDAASTLTPEEQECEDHFRATHSRDASGRYIVRIPLQSSRNLLGNSYRTAHHCLQRMLKKLERDDTLKKLYANFMREYEDLEHMVRVSGHSSKPTHHGKSTVDAVSGEMTLAPDASKPFGGLRVSSGGLETRMKPVYYLPHHGVLRPDSTTTKLRVVFNGSSSTSSGRSVNDIMHTGPNLLLDVFDVLIWIRHHRHIFATDVTKMYRQIKVYEDDWDLQRILWVDEHLNEAHYQLTTVTYGTKAAPYLAVRALIQLVEDEGHRFPLAIPSLLKGRYVDDIFGGADSSEQLIKIAHQLTNLCKAGGFPLAKWQATDQALLAAVSATHEPSKPISFDDCSTKTLGLKWLPRADTFVFTAKPSDHSKPITKRLILSEVAQIFDPLGLISPVTIRAKLLLQELWLHKINWDDPLPSHIISRWSHFREDLKNLAQISIPRWFHTWTNSTVELHGFSDASQLAMSAVVYIVSHSPSTGAKSSLVCAKTKVAPIKPLTIPRLELTAALLLSKLIKHTQATLQLPITSTHLWTDSQVALMWIKSPASRWKDFVRNRVTQIQELTPQAHWRHVPGTSNPADGPSRGLTAQQLKDHSLWWTGPPWILKPMTSWPRQTQPSADLSAHEARQGAALFVATPRVEYHWDLIHRYSTLSKLIRVTALCSKVISRLRRQTDSPLISRDDMEAAKVFWIKATQAAYFSHELRSLKSNIPLQRTHVFSRLTAFLDHEGVIRVGGRLNLSTLSPETKHPAILPRHSRLSTLVIDNSHRRTLHEGTQLTLADIRQSYWILGGRAPVKTHILHCVKCARQRGIRAQQLMGQLPVARVTPSRPFTHTGVDYAGPLTLKTWKGRSAKTMKGWICVFVCLTTSAVHLEAVSDYSTDGFIAAYRRFVSRRGIPGTLYSDCGTNFVGADAALKRMITQHTHESRQIASLLAVDGTQWHFNPPATPHMGGKWEAVVKAMKYHLRRIVGETVLTFEELTTMLSQIEAVLNSRPLEALSDDPEDVSALTPGHFLTGDALSSLPEPSLTHLNINHLSRWQLIQQKIQNLWS